MHAAAMVVLAALLTIAAAHAQTPSADEIREAQRILRSYGLYDHPADGIITPTLEAMARASQGKRGNEPIAWPSFIQMMRQMELGKSFEAYLESAVASRNEMVQNPEKWATHHTSFINRLASKNGYSSLSDARYSISFLLRGAILFPLQLKERAAYFLFYNPISDVGLIIGWTNASPTSDITNGFILPGELIRGFSDGTGPPYWATGRDIEAQIQLVASQTRRRATALALNERNTDLLAAYEELLTEARSRTARERILLTASAVFGEDFPCKQAFDKVPSNLAALKQASGQDNISLKIENNIDYSTFSIGGGSDRLRAFRFYTLRANPNVLITLYGDLSTCVLGEARAINVIDVK